MGTLDDAIREHLELKRQKGAPDEELDQKEAEAFGRGAPPRAPEPQAQPSDEPPRTFGDPETAEAPGPRPDALEEELLDPDEVLPQESLENGTVRSAEAQTEAESARRADELALGDPDFPELDSEPEPPARAWRDPDVPEPAAGETGESEPEDLLEETPDFLEETPEHDRLWFEQKPPKDFDFD